MPLRRLIALIINTHRALKPKDTTACAATMPMNMIRKTILLQHPSGSQALQDLSLACKVGAFAAYPEGQTPNAPGDMSSVPADQKQPDECLLTMSNNICDPAGNAKLPSQKNVLSSDKYSTPFPRKWWSQTGSNRRPPECKSGALPAELWPLRRSRRRHPPTASVRVVGLGRLELPTSRLSSARSNQLSYKPVPNQPTGRRPHANASGIIRYQTIRTKLVREERETKTTISRILKPKLLVLKKIEEVVT